MSTRIVILGSGFAGLTIAADLRDRLGAEPDITVISNQEDFLGLRACLVLDGPGSPAGFGFRQASRNC